MTRILILERKRLFPLAILICLLIVITVYDSMTKSTTATVDGEAIHVVNVDQGRLKHGKELVVIDNLDTWVNYLDTNSIPHPDYSFDDNNQLALISVNFTVQDLVENVDEFGETYYNIFSSEKKDTYKIYIIPKPKDISINSISWNFYDSRGEKKDNIEVKVNPR
ncbi:hypothetical protein PRVXT_001736 [Proteinivorax tanatarense]|uniref:Uncharacterized protein n=1 Tax=Proteinivorax tanatarense TaxID=1260629 RepID=A0AAU7VIS9_9FIRM